MLSLETSFKTELLSVSAVDVAVIVVCGPQRHNFPLAQWIEHSTGLGPNPRQEFSCFLCPIYKRLSLLFVLIFDIKHFLKIPQHTSFCTPFGGTALLHPPMNPVTARHDSLHNGAVSFKGVQGLLYDARDLRADVRGPLVAGLGLHAGG